MANTAPPGFLAVQQKAIPFTVTLAEANAPTPDLLLTEVMANAVDLAKQVDTDVIPQLYTGAGTNSATATTPDLLQEGLIGARADVEIAGYRAPSCVITNTEGLKKLSQLTTSGYSILQQLLAAANVNSLYRTVPLDPPDTDLRLVLIGRRRRIAQGAAPEASPGEEPVDLAVSLLPSLEVDGETAAGDNPAHRPDPLCDKDHGC